MKKLESKGITLVALVITIIILLILAGITISQLMGNGLFEKAEQAKVRTEEKQKLENETLEEYEKIITKATRENDNSVLYDISSLSTEYNPYGLRGYILYDEDSGILEVNLYDKKVSFSNETVILNISFIKNLPTLDYSGIIDGAEQNTNYHMLAGTGLAVYGGSWGSIILKIKDNYDIKVNNMNGQGISLIGTYKRNYKIKII